MSIILYRNQGVLKNIWPRCPRILYFLDDRLKKLRLFVKGHIHLCCMPQNLDLIVFWFMFTM